MRVRALVEALQKCDPNAYVAVYDRLDNYHLYSIAQVDPCAYGGVHIRVGDHVSFDTYDACEDAYQVIVEHKTGPAVYCPVEDAAKAQRRYDALIAGDGAMLVRSVYLTRDGVVLAKAEDIR